MLTTRTKRAAAAALLGVFGLFVAGAANAQPVYAAETIGPADARNPGYHTIGFTATDKVIVRVPQAILSGLAYYARVELTNMRVSGGNMGLYINNAANNGDCPATIVAQAPGSGAANTRTITFSTAAKNGTAAVYALSDNVATTANACMQFGLVSSTFGSSSGLGIQTTGKTMQLNVKLYDSLAGAIRANPDNLLGNTTTATVATFRSAVTARVDAMPASTASVERGFAAFTGTGAAANVASLATVKLLTNHLISSVNTGGTVSGTTFTGGTTVHTYLRSARQIGTGGTQVNGGAPINSAAKAAGLVGASTVYIKSTEDPIVADEDIVYKLTGTGCTTIAKATGARAGQLVATVGRTGAVGVSATSAGTGSSAKHTVTPTGDGAGCVLSLDVKKNADKEAAGTAFQDIMAQKYTADVMVALPSAPTLAAGKNLSGVPAGEIKRDGTTVHLPFLVVKTGYAQKVVLTNRATKTADFWIDNVTGNGTTAASSRVTATDSTKPKLEVGAGSSMTVAVADLVDLGTGGTEGSATLNIDSSRANVDVVTVLTNNSTNSTDSLSLEPVAN